MGMGYRTEGMRLFPNWTIGAAMLVYWGRGISLGGILIMEGGCPKAWFSTLTSILFIVRDDSNSYFAITVGSKYLLQPEYLSFMS